MTGPAWLLLGLALALCSCAALSQFIPEPSTIHLDMYLQNMTFDAKTDLGDRTSAIYAEMKAKVEEVFQPLGGRLEDVIFSDGGGCVKVYVTLRDYDENKVMGVTDTLIKDGIEIWGETWKVSFTSCGAAAELHLLRFKFYVVDMPWTDNMMVQGSAENEQLMMLVKSTFSDLGGSLRVMKVTQNNGCVEFYVEWDAMTPNNILRLMDSLKTSGVTVDTTNYKIQTKPCLPAPAEVNECPSVPSGISGACAQMCSDADPAMKCSEGFKCCSNGCGVSCVRVGYTVKINSTIVVDLPWMSGMEDPEGAIFTQAQTSAKQMINEVFNLGGDPLVVDVELKGLSMHSSQGKMVSVLNVVMYLSRDPANSMLMNSADMLNQLRVTLGTTPIKVLSVRLGNGTMKAMCGGIECHGICKETRSGLQYCSCNPGSVGPDCASMDCRSDLTQLPGANNNECANNGECGRSEEGDMGYECSCQPGYFGPLCQVRLCDLLTNPCNGQGTCVGDVDNGQICECNANRGGLFCEEALTVAKEDFTLCQRLRRLMQFVHAQVRGDQTMSPMLNMPMSQVLYRMGEANYSIPYCYEVGSGMDGNFYSMCMYDAETAKKGNCFCVGRNAQPNYWHYFGEDDCRVFSGTLIPMEWDFFVHGITWSDSLLDEESRMYIEIKNQIIEIMSVLGGYLARLDFKNNGGCIKGHLTWSAEFGDTSKATVARLLETSFTVNGQAARFSDQPCQSIAELHLLQVKFYVVGMPWSQNLKSQTSAEYMGVKMLVEQSFSDMGGELRTLEMEKNNGCVEFYVEWNTELPENILELMASLKTNGVTFDNQNYKIQTKPCLPTAAEVDECPPVPSDVFGTCDERCNDADPSQKCPEGFKCCSNGCGHACARVGYTVKINASVVVDTNWVEGMQQKDGAMFSQIQTLVKEIIIESFNLGSETSVADVELKSISRKSYKGIMNPMPMLNLVIYFDQDPPNKLLMEARDRMMQMPIVIGDKSSMFKAVMLAAEKSMCDGMECDGICKELRSGLQYCSCHPGYIGPDCATFDCRKDATMLPTAENNQCLNGGECVRAHSFEVSIGFECDCQPSYYGAMCEVRLCDLMTNPCNSQGTCVGDVHSGKICECNDYRGGIFCEKAISTPKESLTMCEQHRRLMLFVHAQVRKDEGPADVLNFPMSQILHKMMVPVYNIPYCESVDKEFYSMCNFNSMDGSKEDCYCVSRDGVPNSWDYVAEDDCRVYTMPLSLLQVEFYIMNVSWSDSLKNMESELYMEIKDQIVEIMNPLGGYLKEMKFDDYVGCVAVRLQWNAESPYKFPEIFTSVMTSGITVGGEVKELSREPCQPKLDLYACPVLDRFGPPDGLLGLCAMTCPLDGDTCGEGKKCCKNSCGGSACIEVGFLQKLVISITMDVNYVDAFKNPSSQEYQTYAGALAVIDERMKSDIGSGYKSAKLLGLLPGRVSAPRTKRQTMLDKLVIQIEAKFTEEIPVEKMNRFKTDLMVDGIPIGGTTYYPLDVTVGSKDCENNPCESSSFCVTRVGGESQCACPESKTGARCEVRNCNKDGESLCQNGGKCHYQNFEMQMYCDCPHPYLGEFCEVLMCDLVKPGTCNSGTCMGDLTDFRLCDCPSGRGGLFCELSEPDGEMSLCERHHRLTKYALDAITGKVSDNKMTVSMSEFLSRVEQRQLMVPKCWPRDDVTKGEYASACLYDIDSGDLLTCICLNRKGEMTSQVYNRTTEMCEVDDGCLNLRCLNGGSCMNLGKGNARCSCLRDFTGRMCEKEADDTDERLPCDPRPCKDEPSSMCMPCGNNGFCLESESGSVDDDMYGDMDYMCKCNQGYSGDDCEINDGICSMIPDDVCELSCIGDIGSGNLCRCPTGYGGILCNKPARTSCEKRKALYDDAVAILRGKMSIDGYNMEQIQQLVRMLVMVEGGQHIPVFTCSDSGFYEKVQCMLSIEDLESKYCMCVDHNGNFIESNIEPHIGYEVCTAPSDFRPLAGMICGAPDYYASLGIELTLCQNGGECTFDIYDGKICDCSEPFGGQFCQETNVQSESRSMCEFMAAAWDISHQIFTSEPSWITSEIQKQLYLNTTYAFLSPMGNGDMILKPECKDDGTFKAAGCYYNVSDGTKGPCYCWGMNGPLLGKEVNGPEAEECAELWMSQCTHLEMCPGLRCEYGYKESGAGCPICACYHPCETMKCDNGHRCVVQKMKDCHEDSDMKCSKPMCVPREKPGACPGYDDDGVRLMSSIPGGGLALISSEAESCPVTCFDDSDCEGDMKCCGLCGSKCVKPEGLYSCREDETRMANQLDFLLKVRQEMIGATNLTRASMRLLERISDADVIWVPECDDNDYLYKPMQCVYTLDNASEKDGTPVSCFCVDRLGNKVPGATADFFAPESCNVKPFSCPYVDKPEHPDDVPHCEDDLDCIGGEKCCSFDDDDYKVCAKPVDEAKLSTTVDRLMSSLCEDDEDLCQGSSTCVGKWNEEGIACQCPSNRYGPFCGQTSVEVVPRTACERKVLARKVFLKQSGGEMENYGIAELVKRDMMRKMEKMGMEQDGKEMVITAIWYNCTKTGAYMPMQCIMEVGEGIAMTEQQPTYCFCVDEDGMEILGTRLSAKDGRRPFCGDLEGIRTCPVGYAYHNAKGEMVMGDDEECPDGYASKRSTYGHRYCCPTEEGLKNVCDLPMDVGMDCPEDMPGMKAGTRYYYNEDEEQCMSFNYKGCAGNRNSFGTMEDCLMRCKEKVHPGTCPSMPLSIAANGECEDHCDEDDACDESYKCCGTSCGKRCIPVGDEGPSEKKCPVGQPRESMQGGACNKNKPCERGYICVSNGQNPNAAGFCCPDYERVDLCSIPPNMGMEKYGEPMDRYFFNSTSKMCEKFQFYGTMADFNNFKNVDDCCQACNGEGRCKMGKCPAVRPGLVSSCKHECSADAQCPGKKICCYNGCGHVCVVPEEEQVSDCKMRQMEVKRRKNMREDDDNCDLISMPMCEKDGSWSKIQCQTVLGICWCVTPYGNYIDNTVTRGVPQCDTVSDSAMRSADTSKKDVASVDFPVCPGGEDIHCCPEALCKKRCPSHPDAKCRINPCGGCKAEYYSASGMMVDCEEGLGVCEKELKTAAIAIQEHQMTAAMAKGDEEDMEDAMEKYREKMQAEATEKAWAISTRYPGRCLLRPESGMCEGFMPQWYFNPASGKCEMFIWGMCGGNDNRFSSPEDCYNTCDVEANPCMRADCTGDKPVCQLQYDDMCYMAENCEVTTVCTERDDASHKVMDIFVPRCLSSGEYHYKQCHGDYCWCVNSQGQYAGGFTREDTNALTCDQGGVSSGFTQSAACPNGQQPNPACVKSCTGKKCPGNPMARCVADLCSADCNTMFVDMNGDEVECDGDQCSVFTFEEKDDKQCEVKLPCKGSEVKNCPESICEKAMMQNCSKNPCAICMVDPCTCKPYFVDVNTRERLSNAQCQYLSLGACEVKKCYVLTEIEKAKFNKIELANAESDIPDCDIKGKFKEKQCRGSKCECVDEYGAVADANSDGSCKKIDEIKKIKVTFTFKADFNKFKNDKKLSQLKDEILKKLVENGIDPRIIKIGEPYAGSIKVDVTIEDDPNAVTNDMAVVDNVLEQMTNTGALDLDVDGETIPLETTDKQAQTASQIAEEEQEEKKDDGGLDTTEIVIIACVCGGIGLIIIAVIIYFVCCRRRTPKEPVDDSFDHVRESESKEPPFTKTVPTFHNHSYEEDDRYIKMKF